MPRQFDEDQVFSWQCSCWCWWEERGSQSRVRAAANVKLQVGVCTLRANCSNGAKEGANHNTRQISTCQNRPRNWAGTGHERHKYEATTARGEATLNLKMRIALRLDSAVS